jgi:phosphohistidine phosphatase SixA
MGSRRYPRSVQLLLLAVLAAASPGCDRPAPPVPPTPPPAPAAKAPQAVAPTPAPPAPAPQAGPPVSFADDAALVRALRAGGYVLAFRHAHTDMSQKDEQGDNYDDCAKQRNLDDQGRMEARMIGESIKTMHLPIAAVYSSPFCRNKETAQLAFGAFTLQNACMGEDEASVAARATLLSTPPRAGQNVAVVTHRHSMARSTGLGLETFGEGGALVIIPRGGSNYEIVHTIDVKDWERLATVARGLE